MNPCPCGYYPDPNKCRCTPFEVKRYMNRVSGPILDRIDICTEAPKIDIKNLTENRINETSQQMRNKVMEARERQNFRFQNTGIMFNSQMGPKEIKKYCSLGLKEQAILERAFSKMNLSARGYHRIIKVARTIADLEKDDIIKSIHLTEAICYRNNDRKYWC
jgi:magnesium chelatase family protein